MSNYLKVIPYHTTYSFCTSSKQNARLRVMDNVLFFLIIISLLSVVAVLALGIFSMLKGGEFNEKYGNKLMQMRVILQTLAVLLLAFAALLSQN